MSQQPSQLSALQQQVLRAMAIPLWQRREQPAAVVAPLTLVGGDDVLRQSRLYAALLRLLALPPELVSQAVEVPEQGRCWLLVADCPAPRLQGELLITPPLLQLQQLQHKRQLWQLVQQWL